MVQTRGGADLRVAAVGHDSADERVQAPLVAFQLCPSGQVLLKETLVSSSVVDAWTCTSFRGRLIKFVTE